MEKVIINKNTPVEETKVFNLPPARQGQIVDVDGTLGIRVPCLGHGLSEGDTVYFRKVSGTGDTSTWDVYGEVEAKILSVMNKNAFVISIPAVTNYTITYVDGDNETITLSQDYPLLPEDYNEIWQGNGIIGGVLKDYNDDNNDIQMGPFYPVFRKRPLTSQTEYYPDYDRSWINTRTISVIDGIEYLPTVTGYTYLEYTTTSETEVLLAERYDSVPPSEEITDDDPDKIYTVENDGSEDGLVRFFQKIQQVIDFDYEELAGKPLIINYNPFVLMGNNYAEGDTVKIYGSTQIIEKRWYYSVDLGFTSTDEHNLLQQNTIEEYFSKEIKGELVPDIIDMEKVMFEPCFTSSTGTTLLDQINFNFHFRYRKVLYKELEEISSEVYSLAVPMGSLPVIEENMCIPFAVDNLTSRTQPLYVALTSSTGTTYYQRMYDGGWHIDEDHPGWNNITAGTPYSGLTQGGNRYALSDLMGYLNFNEDDIRYQKEKIKHTFIRLSFYDSPNPLDQQLLGYSTIFVDAGELAGKYFRNKAIYGSNYNIYLEPINNNGYETAARIGSQMTVKNKFDTTKSSEGFYIYLFKNEVDEETPEKTIYMKVDYNHAGNGRSIPFTRPKFKPSEGFGRISAMDFEEYFNYLYVKIKLRYNPNTEPHYTYEFITPTNTPSEETPGVTNEAYGVVVSEASKTATITLFEPLFNDGNN